MVEFYHMQDTDLSQELIDFLHKNNTDYLTLSRLKKLSKDSKKEITL